MLGLGAVRNGFSIAFAIKDLYRTGFAIALLIQSLDRSYRDGESRLLASRRCQRSKEGIVRLLLTYCGRWTVSGEKSHLVRQR